MDDANVAEAAGVRFFEVGFHSIPDVSRRDGVQVEDVSNRYLEGFLGVQSLAACAVASLSSLAVK